MHILRGFSIEKPPEERLNGRNDKTSHREIRRGMRSAEENNVTQWKSNKDRGEFQKRI